MIDRQQFKEGIKFIKSKYKTTTKEIAIKLGEPRHVIDNPIRGNAKPSLELIDRLIELYPESKTVFATIDIIDRLEEPQEHGIYSPAINKTMMELVETQKKLIEMMEAELEKKRMEVERLRGELKGLREARNKG